MSSGPSNDPVVQQLQLLLTGYGYNFYNSTNQARADDILVRERASYHLAQAVRGRGEGLPVVVGVDQRSGGSGRVFLL